MSKVSIVIPFWKGSEYLKDCVKSVENQLLPDYEMILVCDAGAKEVPEEVTNHPKVKVQSLTGDTPFGVAHCRNVGMSQCQGEYVYFLDSDDYLLEGTLSSMLNLAEQVSASVTTGAVTGSWFSLRNYEPDKATVECGWKETLELKGKALKERFQTRFSATHLLIKREWMEQNKVTFSEKFSHYSDMAFVVRLLQLAKGAVWYQGTAVYVTRYHNDPIHLPSLSQMETKECAEAFLFSYRDSCSFLTEADAGLKEILECQLVAYVQKRFPKQIGFDKIQDFRNELLKVSAFHEKTKGLPFWQKRKLNAIFRGHYKLGRLAGQLDTLAKKKKGIFGSKIQRYRVLEHFIFRKMPVRKDWVIFESFFGKSYSDSPKYLYEYMQKKYGEKFRYIWVLNQKSDTLKKTGKHKTCKRESLRYVYYMSRCGYKVMNVRQPGWYKKRPGVIFLETWHGTPLKKLGFDLGDVYTSNPNLKSVFYEQAKEWDYLVSANRFSTDVFERAFGCDRDKILEYGYPRNDILYAENKDEISTEVKRELGIPEGKRVILYAPTWRDNQSIGVGQYKFQLALDLSRMREEFGADSVVLLRTHYYIADMLDLSEYAGFVYNGSQYEDVSRLYLASDICITDYSSVFFDYANLKRPILFFAYDYEAYADEIRGLYIDMDKELPGPVLHTNDELMKAISEIAHVGKQYRERYEKFYDRFCSIDDGRASERVIEKVFGK